MPAPLPPWFFKWWAKVTAEADYVHTDSCSWMGGDAEHPCSCRVPELLRLVAEQVNIVTDQSLDLERPCEYVDHVPDLPDVTVLPKPPKQEDAKQWVTTWRPVRFHRRGTWRVGIIKAQVQLPDDTWVLLIEHASEGMRTNWPAMLWAVHDPLLIVPIKADPPS